ncbi:MAG: DUF2252 domain-containing protein [Thermoleophilia bacterium]|nr:DUF2252 domain-containing protein [Thermoleophilia bacterium]
MSSSSTAADSPPERTLPTVEERQERGREARKQAPRSSHGDWSPAADRPDPIETLMAQDAGRLQFLVPIRHQRMGVSAFTFYRGTAAIMANDLAGTPDSSIRAQLCGDAHLSNFGGFASPERTLIFDVNDFDETLPGPWEWDLKRLAASLVLAGRNVGLSRKDVRAVVAAGVDYYRSIMQRLAAMSNLDVWYRTITADEIRSHVTGNKKQRKKFDKGVKKAHRRNSLRAFSKLTETVDGRARIRSDPPLLVPMRDLATHFPGRSIEETVRASLERYRETISPELQTLLARYEFVDAALKVVGVGSVGTRCFAVLLIGRDEKDPLFLQVKEADKAALEAELPSSRFSKHGRRVVEGQRLMQSFSDIFLGWSSGKVDGQEYYWRQLKDMKASADVDSMDFTALEGYARICGAALARAHARSGDEVAIATYLGKSGTFTKSMTRFAEVYADQAEADYEAFREAIDSGRLSSETPEDSPVRS